MKNKWITKIVRGQRRNTGIIDDDILFQYQGIEVNVEQAETIEKWKKTSPLDFEKLNKILYKE